TGHVAEVLRGGQGADPLGRARGHGPGDRVLGGVLQGAREAQYVLLVGAVGGVHGQQGHPAGGDGAGLVEDDGVDGAGALQDLRALDEDAELGAAAGADHQRGRRGQPEGAGAGDDQDGDGGGERGGRSRPVAQPEPEGAQGQCDDDRDEDGGDAVGEPLGRRLAVLRVLDPPRHPGDLGVGADPGGRDAQPPAGVDGGAGDGVPDGDLDRDGLAGQHGRVDGGGALGDRAVGGDLLAGPDQEAVAHGELPDRDLFLPAVAQHGDVLGAQLHQRPQGGPGAALGTGLEVAPGQDERGHPGGGLQVDVGGAVAAGDGQLEGVGHAGGAGGAE